VSTAPLLAKDGTLIPVETTFTRSRWSNREVLCGISRDVTARMHAKQALEAACRRALTIGTCGYKSIESILRKSLDRQTLPQQQELNLSVEHENIRGADSYH